MICSNKGSKRFLIFVPRDSVLDCSEDGRYGGISCKHAIYVFLFLFKDFLLTCHCMSRGFVPSHLSFFLHVPNVLVLAVYPGRMESSNSTSIQNSTELH
jgi:hypothetical protein